MTPGELNKRIAFYSNSPVNTAGELIDNWVLSCTVWGKIRTLSSRELLAADAVQSETTHKLTIRYRTGMVASMRAVVAGRIFDIGPPRNVDERNEWLVMPAKEGVNNG